MIMITNISMGFVGGGWWLVGGWLVAGWWLVVGLAGWRVGRFPQQLCLNTSCLLEEYRGGEQNGTAP